MADHVAALRGLPSWHRSPIVRDTLSTIRRFGWAVTAVGDGCACGCAECSPSECTFAYTTGLALHGIPDIAIYGLGAHAGNAVLHHLVDLFHRVDWRSVVDGRLEISVPEFDARIRVIEMVDKSDLLITNELFPNQPALQAVWSDDLGSFPWQIGYCLTPADQTVKGIPDFGSRRTTGPRTLSTTVGPNRQARRRARRRRPRH